MFSKLSKHSSVKNILVISLSNIGDIILVAPAMDILMRDFPDAKMSLVVGAKAVSLFDGNSRIENIHVFDKKMNSLDRAKWTLDLRKYKYDLVVDFRNSMIGYFLFPKWITPPLISLDRNLHLKDQHLARLRSLYEYDPSPAPIVTLAPTASDEILVQKLINPFLSNDQSFVVIAPKAADSAKTWAADNFAQLIKAINLKYGIKVIVIGSADDKKIIDDIERESGVSILNLGGQLSLIQSVGLIKRAKIAIVHDSGPMHIASYFNKPIVALYGHTDPKFSRPWSSLYKVIRRNEHCPRCLNPYLLDVPHNCMSGIKVQDVVEGFGEVYEKI